jgi:hypothetical protein
VALSCSSSLAVHFIHFAVFGSKLLSLHYYLVGRRLPMAA